MKVAIFIQTRTKRVGVLKEAKAKWVVECALKDGTVQSRNGIVSCENATESRAALIALRDALKRFTKAADIRLYIADNYVRNMILNGNLTKWKKNGWQGSRGTIKMLDLWKEVSELMEMHLISSAYGLELELKRLKKMEEELNGIGKDRTKDDDSFRYLQILRSGQSCKSEGRNITRGPGQDCNR